MIKDFKVYMSERIGAMYIGRSSMPQINDHEDFKTYLDSQSIPYTQGIYLVDSIIPIQADIDQNKVNSIDPNTMKPIIISSGMYILDGHHRFFASLLNDQDQIEAIQVDKDINQLLITANEYVDSGGADD